VRSRELAGVACMVAATLLWGATFVAIRDTVSSLDPAALVFARFAAAAVILGVAVVVARSPLPRAALTGGALAGLLAVGGFLFQAIGLTGTSAGSSAFLTCAGTLLAGVFAWPLLGERPGPVLAAGLLLAAGGAALLTLREGLHLGAGELWTLLGAVSYALQIVAVARYAGRVPPLALAFVQSVVVAAVLSYAAPAALRGLPALGPAGWTRFAYLAIAGSVLAPLLQVTAQRMLPAGRIGLLFALEPLFALVFALTLGAERFAVRWWLGAALILLAVVMVEAQALRRESRPAGAAG